MSFKKSLKTWETFALSLRLDCISSLLRSRNLNLSLVSSPTEEYSSNWKGKGKEEFKIVNWVASSSTSPEIKLALDKFEELANVEDEEPAVAEKLTKRSKVDDFVDDFKKSDAKQFKGKSQEKRRKMAVAAYLAKQNDK